jgi:hypothetical protein
MPNRHGENHHRPKAVRQLPQKADPNDRTPPRKGDPEQVENVPGREEIKRDRRPDRDETYRTGRQGPR